MAPPAHEFETWPELLQTRYIVKESLASDQCQAKGKNRIVETRRYSGPSWVTRYCWHRQPRGYYP
jgi:hypothetical protein